MQITSGLIKKFLNNRCSHAEAMAVLKHLDEHPGLLSVYLQTSWNEADEKDTLPDGYSDEMLTNIREVINHKKRFVQRRDIRWAVGIAASVLVVVSIGWLYNVSSNAGNGNIVTKPAGNNSVNSDVKINTNTTKKPLIISLPDGTIARLAPGAVIRYKPSFTVDARETDLIGTADFDVARDPKRPFSVHSGMFSIKALGTSFRIAENETSCTVKLFTGKVMIRANGKHVKGWGKDVFLLPGEEMSYNLLKKMVSIKNTDRGTAHPSHKKKPDPKAVKLVFDNTPLPEVMKALQKRYNSSIEYNKDQLEGMYFSGEVLKDDSLEVLLKVIAQMNALLVAEKQDGFIISKIK